MEQLSSISITYYIKHPPKQCAHALSERCRIITIVNDVSQVDLYTLQEFDKSLK